MASKCIFKVEWSWPPNVSLRWYADCCNMHHWCQLMFPSKCLSKLTPVVDSSSLPNLLGHSLQVHLCAYSISGSKCISKLAQSRPSCSCPGFIGEMNFRHCQPPGVCDGRRSVNLEPSISGEDQTLPGHSGWPLKELESRMTCKGAPWKLSWQGWKHLALLSDQCRNPKLTLRVGRVLRHISSNNYIVIWDSPDVHNQY